MSKIKEHAKRHAQKVVHFSKHVHRKLQSPVHPYIGWWVLTIVSMSCFLIISGAFAQTGSSTLPSNEQQPPAATAPGANLMPLAPIPPAQPPPPSSDATSTSGVPNQPTQPCAPGTQCPNPPLMGGPSGGPPPGPNEEQRQQMDQQRFEMMKRGWTSFIKEINRVKSQVKSLSKKGVAIPAELTQALTKMDELAGKVKAAKNADELEDITSDLQEASDTIREWMPKLGRLSQFPQMLKQAEKEMTKATRSYASDERRVKASKLDLILALAEFKNAIDHQKALLEQIKELAKTDPDAAMDKLQDEFFDNMDNMWGYEKVIQVSLNIKNGIAQMNREIKDAEKTIKNLQRKKIATGELEQLVADAKAQLGEIKNLASAKPMDVDAVISAVETLMDTKQAFSDKVQDLTGENGFTAPPPPSSNFQFNLPQGYMTGPGSGGPGGGQQTCNINGIEVPGRCEDLQGGVNR